MQSLPDDLVGDVRAEVRRIDMVHAGGDSLAEDGDGTVRVNRPPSATSLIVFAPSDKHRSTTRQF